MNDDRDPARWKRIKTILADALEVGEAEREAFLDEVCRDDADIRTEVESLLAAESPRDSPLGISTAADATLLAENSAHMDLESGQRIGPYRLRQRIGEGGMGEVWEADQERPVKRQVALKLIKWGMDTKSVIARFEAERQALAMMNHPNVARVFDAGSTEQGRPYFAMELVKGESITAYCDRQRLSTRARLELFIQACEGVQHAHQKGIIHRDIKPSNVLVAIQDDKAVPKIIDFGVAKATEHRLTERSVFTELGQLIGTPEYMSPEQAEMTIQDIDTRTDVYSLGVLLYELLVGALPFESRDLRQAGFEEVRRKIREDDPPTPSSRLSTLGQASADSAARRRTDVRSLGRQLRGDLDWITLRALEKDRTRRYSFPSELSADIRRYLEDEAVLATPPSAAYRMKKFVRRHKVGVSAAATVLLIMIAFAATMTIQARRIAAERDRAETANADLETVVQFQSDMLSTMDTQAVGRRLVVDMRQRVGDAQRARALDTEQVQSGLDAFDELLSGANPTDAALRLLDEEILGKALETLDERFAEAPLIDARLRQTIGKTYRTLGLLDKAEVPILDALETRRRLLGEDHPLTLSSMATLADQRERQGRWKEAERLSAKILEDRRRVLGDEHPDTLSSLNQLAVVYERLGRYDDALPLYQGCLEARRRILGDEHADTLWSMNNVASICELQARYDEAETLYLAALEGFRRIRGGDHRDTLWVQSNLASVYMKQRRWDEAEPLLVSVLESRERVLGDDHPETIGSIQGLGGLFYRQGRYAEAEAPYAEVVDARKRVLGPDHPDTLGAVSNLALVYLNLQRYSESEVLLRDALATQTRTLGVDHPSVMISMQNLGRVLMAQSRYAAAEELLRAAIEGRRRVLGETHPQTITATRYLVDLFDDTGRYADQVVLLESMRESIQRDGKGDQPAWLRLEHDLGVAYFRQHRLDEAVELLTETVEALRRTVGSDDELTLVALGNLGYSLRQQGRFEEAEPLKIEAFETRKRVLGDEHLATLRAMTNLAFLYRDQRRHEQAEPLLRTALETRQRVLGDEHPDTIDTMNYLALSHYNQGRYEDAEPLLKNVLETRRRVHGGEHLHTIGAMGNLARLYQDQGRYDEAEPLYNMTLETATRALGDEHPQTLRTLRNLLSLYRETGQAKDHRSLMSLLLEQLEKTANAPGADATAKNEYAWELLICEPDDLRDPPKALKLALEAVETTDDASPTLLDTLSLAYHMTGDSVKAIENQEKAIALLPEGDSQVRKEMKEALAKYEAALE